MKSPPLERFIELYGHMPTEFDKRYLELVAMGRYRILDVPDVQPGSCCNCGASRNDGRKYVDTGRHVEWYGAIFICGLCMREYADALGLLETVKQELASVKSLLLSQEDLKFMGERIRDTITQTYEEFKEYYANLSATGVDLTPDTTIKLEPDSSAAVKPAIDETESGVTEPPTSTRRTNIPSLADLRKLGTI